MRQSSFNIVHVAVVVLIVMVLIAIVLPMLGGTRRPARRMQNSTQLRGIHQGLVTYSNSNNGWFPGINELGEDAAITVEERFQILMEEDFITPEYAISPSETEDIQEWDGWYVTGEARDPVNKDNYSYAMLQVPADGGRRAVWGQSLDTHAIVLSDRNLGSKSKPASIHGEPGGPWIGSVLWNDNHIAFENSDALDTFYGRYDPDVDQLNVDDRLFESDGTDDALMLHTGNEAD